MLHERRECPTSAESAESAVSAELMDLLRERQR